MEIEKQRLEYGSRVSLQSDRNSLSFTYGTNGDLSIAVNARRYVNEYNYDNFTITKKDGKVYQLFEKLYNDIKDINVYDEEEELVSCHDKRKKREQLAIIIERNEIKRRLCRENNYSNYQDLFDEDTEIITWHSDDDKYNNANILKIEKEKDAFTLEFLVQSKNSIFNIFDSHISIPVIISGSDSRYQPFNSVFMNLYNELNQMENDLAVEEIKRLIKS